MIRTISYLSLLAAVLFSLEAVAQPPHKWKGHWITRTEDIGAAKAPYLRKTFILRKPLASAELLICGVGYPVTTVNGKAADNAVLDQTFTRYDKTLLYQQHNIQLLLQTGQNVIGVELGNCWYNLQTETIWSFNRIPWRKSPRLLADIILKYTDGTRDTIGTDETWQTHEGPSQFNSLITGEVYDARQEVLGWNTVAFDATKWQPALRTVSPGGELKLQQMPPVKVIREIKSISLKKIAANRWVFNFGENFAGVVRLKVQGKAGDTITLYHNELLAANGSVDPKANTGHMVDPKTDPWFQTDKYVLKGSGPESFTPRFTYHGFQYVELKSTNPNIQISKKTLTGLFYSTAFEQAGTFNSSDSIMNKLYANAMRSYRSNFVSIPTDCPSREKMGWLADAWVGTELGLWNFKSASAYKKYLNDIRDVQLTDGNFAGIAPTNIIGYQWIDPEDPDFGPCWASALTQITATVFRHTADTSVLRENFAANQLFASYLLNKVRTSGYLYRTGLGDFLALQETPKTISSSAMAYLDLQLIADMAATLGKNADANNYRLAADSIKAAFNREFFDTKNQTYKISTLTALAMALECGLCPEKAKASVAAQLAYGVKSRDHKADFGVMGTKFVLRALSDNGYATEAYRLLTNTQAGWGKWIKQGATTLWEGWEPNDQSYNHIFFGDFAAWYFSALGGLNTDDGFQHFTIKPVFPDGLKNVSVTHRTDYGQIKISWKRTNAGVAIDLTIPKHTQGLLTLPYLNRTLTAGTYHFTTKLEYHVSEKEL